MRPITLVVSLLIASCLAFAQSDRGTITAPSLIRLEL
jgi:hypothetical protein